MVDCNDQYMLTSTLLKLEAINVYKINIQHHNNVMLTKPKTKAAKHLLGRLKQSIAKVVQYGNSE
jgi:hypothetical protein